MSTPSFRDLELLSAYLDRELTQKDKTRLVARIVKEPELARALDEMRQTRNMLRQTPHRKAPRNFTLTPKMAGLRPPVPRVVPALSWASAVATVLFICTLGYNFLLAGGGSLSAAAPRASDYSGVVQSAPAATAAPATAAPATQAPALAPNLLPSSTDTATPATAVQTAPGSAQRPKGTNTPFSQGQSGLAPTPTFTPEMVGLGAGPPEETATATPTATPTSTATATSTVTPEPTPEPITSSSPAAPRSPVSGILPWAYVWLGLAALLVSAALLIRWWSKRAFARKIKR